MIEQEVYVALFSVVRSLPEKYRSVFELSFEQGLRNVEVASMLNVAEITVKSVRPSSSTCCASVSAATSTSIM